MKVVSDSMPSLIPEATLLKEKHYTLLSKYGTCHRQVNTCKVFSAEEIETLGECFQYSVKFTVLLM